MNKLPSFPLKLIGIFAILFLIHPNSIHAQSIGASGKAWKVLEDKVDNLVIDLINKEKLPGMTVAVTLDNRLILTKGYGKANTATNKSMRHDSRIAFGSVAKATITGPASYKLLKAKGLDPKTTTLYGPNGIFKNRFEKDRGIGTKRHTPITAMAITPNDRVVTWYTNGTFSTGTSDDLDKHAGPKPYTLPPKRTPADIQAMAIAKNGRVYVWYRQGTRSIGTKADLDAFSPESPCNNDDKSGCVSLPPKKKMENILCAGIEKEEDHVYVWYEDGTVSSGYSLDFDRYFASKPFTVAPGSGGSRYHIRGCGIAGSNSWIYSWYNNKKVSVGHSSELDRYKPPYAYTSATFRTQDRPDDWNKWYRSITIQHLYDHKAGFTRSGSIDAASKQFKLDDSELNYGHVHQHFLRTRPLIAEPGTRYSYSNHGFGLFSLIIEELSGKSYKNYVNNQYLAPIGLKGDVVPRSKDTENRDAHPHVYDSKGNPVPTAINEAGLGVAAGGFTGSAQDLARIMKHLDKRYSLQEIKQMGWHRGGQGKLDHSGLSQGTAYVVIYPPGYTSDNDRDLGGIKIALITNIRSSSSKLEDLAHKIALKVPASNVPASFDIW